MFNIGAGEMILIALVLLIAVGPEQLPGVIRRTGRVVGQLKTMSDNLRRDFNASLDEIERAADVKTWAGPELESTVEAVKDAATEPFKTDLGVDGSTKVTDMWSRPPVDDAATDESDEAATVDPDEADDVKTVDDAAVVDGGVEPDASTTSGSGADGGPSGDDPTDHAGAPAASSVDPITEENDAADEVA